MSDYDWKEICELQDKLLKYCDHEGDEHGEYVRYLTQVAGYPYCMEPEFARAVVTAMRRELVYYEEHCRIVESEVTHTYTTTELEWDDR